MITTQVYADDFTQGDIAERNLEVGAAGSGRFNLLVGIRFEAVRELNAVFTVRVFAGDEELTGATAATLLAQFTRQEIYKLRIEAASLDVHATLSRWFPSPILQGLGSTVILLLETNVVDPTNVPCVIKLVEHDVIAVV